MFPAAWFPYPGKIWGGGGRFGAPASGPRGALCGGAGSGSGANAGCGILGAAGAPGATPEAPCVWAGSAEGRAADSDGLLGALPDALASGRGYVTRIGVLEKYRRRKITPTPSIQTCSGRPTPYR